MNKPIVLVVDDEEININYVVNILQDNYDIRVAYNGQTALNILSKIDINLILLDIKMPNMDGYEVAKHITNDDKLKKIPFIFLTSKVDEESIVKGFNVGAKDYISKPFNIQELKVRVANHIETYTLHKNLESLVDEQTKEIIKQKDEIYKQLKKSAMGELISIIAHQLKQPLNGISINLSLISQMFNIDSLTKDEMKIFEEKIMSQVKFMADSIDDLRNFFRTDKQAQNYKLKHAIDKVLQIIGVSIKSNQIDIKIHLENNDLEILGYESELQQVLINLLSNAKDAINDKKIKNGLIQIRTYEKDNSVYIEVEDNAGGVDTKIIDKIFESYFTTKGQKGTGIGLNLAKMIIEDSMGGNISVKNGNDGAIFKIRINHSTV
jgi:two-component system sensor histidine kinase/response regulator